MELKVVESRMEPHSFKLYKGCAKRLGAQPCDQRLPIQVPISAWSEHARIPRSRLK